MKINIQKFFVSILAVIVTACLLNVLFPQIADTGTMVQRGVVASRGIVLSKDGYPIWVKYDSKGAISEEIGEASGPLAEDKVQVMSADAYCTQEGISSLGSTRTVLINRVTKAILAESDWNIAFKSGFYTKKEDLAQPSPPVVDGTFGYRTGDKLWGPISGAKVEAPGGWRTGTLENGGFGISMNMPVSCMTYTQWLNLLVTMRFKNFDPEDSDHSGFYYLAWPTVFNGGGDVGACLINDPGTIGTILANTGNSLNTVNIPIDVAMMTGTAVFRNDPRTDEFEQAIGIDNSVVGVIPVTDGETEYFVNAEDLVPVYADDPETSEDESKKPFSKPDNQDHALLKTITTKDLENTDTYIFRASNDKLIACIEGLGKDKKNWYYGGGSDGSSGARIHYKMMLRGPVSYQITGRKDNIEKWQSSVQMDEELRGVVADHLKIGEYVKVILVNRATGYIGTQRVKFGYNENGSETLLNFTPDEVIMRPPNLSIRAERKYKVDMGLTKGKEYEHIIGFEGSGLTSDQYISVTTDWVDWDGAALPPDLPGYTGRLAKVVKENTLEEAGPLIANFEIIPGLHKVLLKLPEGALDIVHYYIHVNGESIDDNPDFSTIGAAPDGPLQYRPKHYVPVKIPILNTEATEAARFQAYKDSPLNPVYTPIYHWVYRPEMEFSLYDLEVKENGDTDVGGTLNDNSIGKDVAYQFRIPDLLYTMNKEELPMLPSFNSLRELVFGLGNEQLDVVFDAETPVEFQNPESILTLDKYDILGIRLYQTNDRENVLWQYNFPVILKIVLKSGGNKIPCGSKDTAIAITDPPDQIIEWSISQYSDNKEAVMVEINPITGDITTEEESPEGWIVVRAKLKEFPGVQREELIFVGCPSSCGGSDSCEKPGKENATVGCAEVHFSIGKDTHGKPAGTLMIFSENITSELSTPAKLLFTSLSWDLNEENGISRINAPDGTLRQILAPESFVNIVVPESGTGYDIYFYKPEAAGDKNADGYYEVNTSAAKDAVWRIAGSGQALTVTDILHNKKTYAFTQPDASTMTLTTNNEKLVRRTITQAGDETIVTESVEDTAGHIGSKTSKTLKKFPWGTSEVSSTIDPGGKNLTTEYSYYENLAAGTASGKLKSKVNPDGSWARFEYDNQGRRVKEITSWLDAAPDAPESSARVIAYDYAPLDAGDKNLTEYKHQARMVTESIQGQVVSKTYHAYLKDAFGNPVEITEQCPTPASAYGSSQNLRTSRIYYKDDLKSVTSGKIRQVTSPDYRQDTYDYEKGNYVPGKPGTFTPGSGTDVRETVVHGTAVNPDGIAHKTTKDIRVTDTFGRSLMSASYVYTGSGYAQVQWSVNTLDNAGHIIKTETSTGTVTESVWGCCNQESTIDETGVQTNYFYDALNRLETQSRPGPSGVISTSFTYDAAGRRLTQAVSAGGLSQATSSAYDTAGRLKSSTDPSGLTTVYEYSADGRTTTVTRPGGATEVTERYMDGQVKRISGTGTVERVYEYGVNADNTLWTKVYTGGQSSAMWEKSTTDVLGRVVKTEKPGFAGAVVTASNAYNNIGQLIKTQTTGQADQVVEYDELGNQIRSGLDVDGSGGLELASADRITETDTRYAQIGDDWWQQNEQKIYAQENADETKSTGISRNRITGLGAGLIAESISIDMFGNQTVSKTIIDRASHTETRSIDYPDSLIDAQSESVNGFMISSTGKTGVTMTYAYDALGRQTGVTDPRTGTSVTHYDAKGRVDYVEDAAGSRTVFAYDLETGRKISETNALGKSTRYAYNLQGQVTRTWGDAAYPVEYGYDGFGRMTAMTTFRTGSGWDGVTWPTSATGDTTVWTYDDATGLLISKTDAAGNAVSYTYDASGRLDDRTWARTDSGNPIVTDYAYNTATGELTGIDYSDATPDIAFTYDRLGRQTHVTDATGSRTFAYTDNLQPASETITGLINRTITRQYETSGVKGRNAGFSMNNYEISYGYDDAGRMDGASWNVNNRTGTASYAYVQNSDLLSTLSTNSNFTATYTYEPHRNLKISVQNAFGVQVVSNYAYQYDTLGRRTNVTNTGVAFSADAQNKYQYNDRNELTESSRFMGTDPDNITQPVEPEYRAYRYDPIGNREEITEAANTGTFTANNLNQYTGQAVPGDGTRSFDYDADGNLTSLVENSSETVYIWNAENRLVTVQSAAPADGDKKVEFVYDYMGRRVKKSVYSYSSDSWLLTSEFFFLFDGWNLVEETTKTGSTTSTRYFVWGQDLSQSLQGAGGIGGLIAAVDGSTEYLYCFDANGNVGQVVNAADGAIAASYEYDPYGKPIKAGGAYAADNPFRFSTKYHDDETGLVYYGYRYYSAELGRWLNRDPIEEEGGLNLYGFVLNQPTDHYDPYGNFVETLWDIISLGAGVVELVVAPSWVAAGAVLVDVGATVIPGIPGGAGAGARAVRLGKGAAEAVKVANGTAKAAGTAHKITLVGKVAAKTTTACAKATVVLQKMPYKQLAAIKSKLGLGNVWEAHHIIEKRFYKAFKVLEKNTDDWMAVALDKAQHDIFTERWSKYFPKSGQPGHMPYESISPERIIEVAKKVYADAPEILQNLPKLP